MESSSHEAYSEDDGATGDNGDDSTDERDEVRSIKLRARAAGEHSGDQARSRLTGHRSAYSQRRTHGHVGSLWPDVPRGLVTVRFLISASSHLY